MNFIYRGVAFNAGVTGTPAQETEQTGTFLGKRYQMKQAQVAHRRSATELKYRGVSYTR
ncbi:MAG: DUF4278 domain-containing protein [Cyanobacteria bacterium P01_A01_bin.123]